MALAAALLVASFASVATLVSSGVPKAVIAPNVSMPMLAFGTMTISNPGCTVQAAVEQWLRLGGRHLDMSLLYKTQPDVGRALKAVALPREELFLTTKVEGPIGYNKTLDQVTNTDLPMVGVDYFDLVLIHFPCPDFKDFPNKCGSKFKEERLDTWRALETLRSSGKVRAIGISNFNSEQARELTDAGYQPAVNQVQWHLGYHNDTFLEEMGQLGIKLEAWASLAGPTKSHSVPGVSLSDERLKTVAARYNASTAQVALQWEVRKGITPVTATCNADHAVADLKAFDFNLSSEDVRYLDSLEERPSSPVFV